MDGSEEGEVLPAAVLSGAPIELQARTVRYDKYLTAQDFLLTIYQHLPPNQNSYTVGRLAPTPLENGLGYLAKGPQMGESTDGMAIFW